MVLRRDTHMDTRLSSLFRLLRTFSLGFCAYRLSQDRISSIWARLQCRICYLFQRISVIVSDLCLLFGVYRLTRKLEAMKRNLICALVIWSPGLLMVGHIHFQYNGFLLGGLLLSISFLQEGRDLLGGFLFAVPLCFKHLFAVAAPVSFVYLLRYDCWSGLATGFRRLVTIGAEVVAVFAAVYVPFIYYGQVFVVFVSIMEER